MAEVRVQAEGILRWVQASGSGRTWATASAPASGIIGFCTEFSYKSAMNVIQIMDRGVPDHHKRVGQNPIEVSFGCLWTGTHPTIATASGASLPMVHLEFKSTQNEVSTASGFYAQFMGVPLESIDFAEAEDGNTLKYMGKALAMATAVSGYLG